MACRARGAWLGLAAGALLLLGSCALPPPGPPPATPTVAPPAAPVAPAPASGAAPAPRTALPLSPSSFAQLPGWSDDRFGDLWQAWRRDCAARIEWLADACRASSTIADDDTTAQRAFFEQWFQPWQLLSADGAEQGLLTGYFEPIYAGSTRRGGRYVVPVWGRPADLVDLPAPPTGQTDRGRLVQQPDGSRQVVPFWSRAQIAHDPAARALLDRHVVAWLANPVDALFLQVQGSGLVRLPDGSLLRLSYDGDNGWPYRSIGRWLLERGKLRGGVTMQSIRAWARAHPLQVQHMLDANPRVVFFRTTPLDGADRGPVGALGVPLTAMRSIAVDKRLLGLGLPIWVSTEVGGRPLRRLMFAQDVGSAIQGALRGDLFFGTGHAAGQAAGRMQSPARMWVLLPRTPAPQPAPQPALAAASAATPSTQPAAAARLR